MAAVDPTKSFALPKFRNRSPDLAGKQFSRLTVIRFAGRNKNQLILWECSCECGGSKIASSHALTSGHVRSCGCLILDATRDRSITHGMTSSPTYNSWRSMIHRCENAGNIGFHRYGGRGITVCEKWHTFENFYADMGERPSLDHSLERKENDGNYEPGNCCWATRSEQANNRRARCSTGAKIILSHDGKTMNIDEWAKHLGIPEMTIRNRLRKRWSLDRVLTSVKFSRWTV